MLNVIRDIIGWLLAIGLLLGWFTFSMLVGTVWANGVLNANKRKRRRRRSVKPPYRDSIPYDGSEFVDDGTFFNHL